MQSIFRLPWSSEDKATVLEKFALQKPARSTPVLDVPIISGGKRKRPDSEPDAPETTQKRSKVPNGGAVQPALEPTSGSDARAPTIMPAHTASDTALERAIDARTRQASGDMSATAPGVSHASSQHSSRATEVAQLGGIAQTSFMSPHIAPHIAPTIVHLRMIDATVTDSRSPKSAMSSQKSDVLRSVIGAQFDLEIRLKHDELRLIELEIAKCQIGLEQLRRCELIPHPATGPPSVDVSQGAGHALLSPQGYTQPAQPAPWGVSDGPYTRHYAQWLLSDPLFDAQPVAPAHAAPSTPATGYTRAGRPTRGSTTDYAFPTTGPPAPRTSRSSTGSRGQPHSAVEHNFGSGSAGAHQGAPNAAVRDPMIVKRQLDGKWVRLICNECHRSNFNNVQGFLNHCRIAHHVEYKSHEAAAIACGHTVEDYDGGETAVPAVPERIALHTPREAEMLTRSSYSVPPTPSEGPLIHPLVLQAPAVQDPAEAASRVIPRPYNPSASRPGHRRANTTVISTGKLPHLASLLQRRGGVPGDLESLIRENSQKVDLSVYNDSEDEDEIPKERGAKRAKTKKAAGPSKSRASASRAGTRQHLPTPLRTPTDVDGSMTMDVDGPGFQSQLRDAFRFNRTNPPPLSVVPPLTSARMAPRVANPSTSITGAEIDDRDMDLSPHTVADSNPGLVSDHDDDDDDEVDVVDAPEPAAERHGSARHGHGGCSVDGIAVEIEDGSDVERNVPGVGRAEGFCGRRTGGCDRE
ncbi:hypothetical protein EJ06DRAFT_76687 [Trichodelitschia bisporula]|uniref:AHC1-like C2H2 zinc-finger domain-containing protein n=1 Tax=Trichodelitschia bisporula TaxID=703511 RepID=A0A6G1HT27_9PEZI|nr:hypothetical protein EJ06DRAFT_76687 [Trichodelitschia bisporula]